MNPEQWQAAKTLFQQVLQADTAAGDALLAQAAQQDPALAAQVRKLLKDHRRAGAFMETPVVERLNAGDQQNNLARGDMIGAFQIMRKIGQGGMADVYLGRHTVNGRQVALKFMRRGHPSGRNRQRFLSEQKALAMMAHPHIAALHQTGETSGGVPYFAMEYVPGLPISTFCDHHRLDLEERLALTLQVLAGLDHAHQKGIIHRDIKPSNILVTRQEGRNTAKIIDFGIIKAAQKLTEETLNTYSDVILGTLNYMAPEQAGIVDQAPGPYTDLYAVGILLYELLTGVSPFQRDAASPALLTLDRLRGHAPCPPSHWFGMDIPKTRSRALLRSGSPDALRRSLVAHFDAPILKLLAQDPAERYASCEMATRALQNPGVQNTGDESKTARPEPGGGGLAGILKKMFRGNG